MYTIIYPWNVEGLLKSGKCICCLDMESEDVFHLENMKVKDYLRLMQKAEKDDRPYVFYYYEEGASK